MEISLKELKSLAIELSEADNNKDFWCRNSSKLKNQETNNSPLILNAYICLHRRNYRTILVDSTGWIYVQLLNLTDEQTLLSKRFQIKQLLNRVRIESFNLIVELLSSNSSSRKIVYVHTDLAKCQFNSVQIDRAILTSSDQLSQDSTKLSIELLKLYSNSSQQLQYSSYFKVESLGPIFANVCSTQMRHLKAKVRADVTVQYIDEKNPESKRFNFIISLLGVHMFYYNFLHVGRIYLLKSDKPLKKYINVCEGVGENSIVSILQVDDSIRILDEFNIPKSIVSYNGQTAETTFDPNKQFIDQFSGILIDKRLTTSNNFIVAENNDSLIDHYDVILPNREIKLVIKPLNVDYTIVVYFETRLSLYELGILPGMKISLLNLNKKIVAGSERVYKAGMFIYPIYDQSANFLTVSDNENVGAVFNTIKKKASLYESLVEMDTIYDSFYKDYTASNITKRSVKNEDQTNENDQIERIRLYFRSSNGGGGGLNGSSNHQRRIMGQLIRIYDLHVKITCRKCSRLSNACRCVASDWRIDFETTMLIDDHTSILKLVYSTNDFQSKLTTQSNLFGRTGDYLIRVLGKYLAEISLPCIPLQAFNEGSVDFDAKLQQSIQEKLGSMDLTLNTSHLELNDATSCFHLVKMDIYKALYDYLYHTCVDKYFVFYIDMSDVENVREMGKLDYNNSNNRPNQQLQARNPNYRPKNEYNHFRLDDINSNEQFKSTLMLRCFKFIPINVDLTDH